MPEFYTVIAQKIFFPNLGSSAPPPSSTPMAKLKTLTAYGRAFVVRYRSTPM